jgi:hypothetical protein
LVLLLFIALVWLAVVTMVVTVCRAAARADAAGDQRLPAEQQLVEEPILDGLVAWDRATAASLRREWLPARALGGLERTTRPAGEGMRSLRARRSPAKHPR